jgi:hypothetical protein
MSPSEITLTAVGIFLVIAIAVITMLPKTKKVNVVKSGNRAITLCDCVNCAETRRDFPYKSVVNLELSYDTYYDAVVLGHQGNMAILLLRDDFPRGPSVFSMDRNDLRDRCKKPIEYNTALSPTEIETVDEMIVVFTSYMDDIGHKKDPKQ